jgi:hypothetical protein
MKTVERPYWDAVANLPVSENATLMRAVIATPDLPIAVYYDPVWFGTQLPERIAMLLSAFEDVPYDELMLTLLQKGCTIKTHKVTVI